MYSFIYIYAYIAIDTCIQTTIVIHTAVVHMYMTELMEHDVILFARTCRVCPQTLQHNMSNYPVRHCVLYL